jgi:hypothetical protein
MNNDDFVRLVETANPAAGGSGSRRPHHAASYPPPIADPFRAQAPPTMDPFFDDDDEYANPPDSAFHVGGHVPGAMQSTASGLPFAHAGAPIAGTSTTTLGDDAKVKTWTFDDDEPTGTLPYAGASAFPGAPTLAEPGRPAKRQRRRWKWPWQKEEEQKGERLIALNDPQQNVEFCSNYISTTKYNIASFVPKFFYGSSAVSLLLLLDLLTHGHRAILEICQPVLPLHRLHSADSRSLSHQQIHHYRTPHRRPSRLCLQRGPRGSCEGFPFPPFFSVTEGTPNRNATNLTPSSTRAAPKCSRLPALSKTDAGRTSDAAMFFGSSRTSSFRPTFCCSHRQSPRVCATLRLQISTGWLFSERHLRSC